MLDATQMVLVETHGHDGDGWYYWEEEYPEEGSVGAFPTREEAIGHAEECGEPLMWNEQGAA